MRRKHQGSIFLGIVAILVVLAEIALVVTLVYWVIRALMKYVGA